jgi:hypothetical protein
VGGLIAAAMQSCKIPGLYDLFCSGSWEKTESSAEVFTLPQTQEMNRTLGKHAFWLKFSSMFSSLLTVSAE